MTLRDVGKVSKADVLIMNVYDPIMLIRHTGSAWLMLSEDVLDQTIKKLDVCGDQLRVWLMHEED